jgi:hypothetical protein
VYTLENSLVLILLDLTIAIFHVFSSTTILSEKVKKIMKINNIK